MTGIMRLKCRMTVQHRLWKSGLQDTEGSTLIEFALTASMFFFLVLGFMTLCYIYFEYNTAACVARDAARWAAVRGSECTATGVVKSGCGADSTAIQTFVQGDLPGSNTMTVAASDVNWCTVTTGGSGGTMTCSAATPADPGNFVRVTVHYPVVSWMPGIAWVGSTNGFRGIILQSTAQHVIWQ